MKLVIELPDWVEEEGRHIRIMAGIEQVAYKYLGEPWMVKTGRCNMCGKCCIGRGFRDSEFPRMKGGECLELLPDGTCGLGTSRPFSCCVGICTHIEGCTEAYKEA